MIAIAAEAAEVAAEAGAIADSDGARSSYAFELRMVVAVSVGAAIVLGVLAHPERLANSIASLSGAIYL